MVATINHHKRLSSSYLNVNECRYIPFERHRVTFDAARNQHVHSRQRLPVGIGIGQHAPQFCVRSNVEHQCRVPKMGTTTGPLKRVYLRRSLTTQHPRPPIHATVEGVPTVLCAIPRMIHSQVRVTRTSTPRL